MFFEQEKCALWWMVLVAFVVSAAPGRAQQVTLPLAEYESLRRRAEPPDVPQPPPPVPVVLESADVELSVGIDSARLTMRMDARGLSRRMANDHASGRRESDIRRARNTRRARELRSVRSRAGRARSLLSRRGPPPHPVRGDCPGRI